MTLDSAMLLYCAVHPHSKAKAHEKRGHILSGIALLAGTALILVGLWHRDRERLAIMLFVAGALLVIGAGVLAAPGILAD